jgi:hypothetical protein
MRQALAIDFGQACGLHQGLQILYSTRFEFARVTIGATWMQKIVPGHDGQGQGSHGGLAGARHLQKARGLEQVRHAHQRVGNVQAVVVGRLLILGMALCAVALDLLGHRTPKNPQAVCARTGTRCTQRQL